MNGFDILPLAAGLLIGIAAVEESYTGQFLKKILGV